MDSRARKAESKSGLTSRRALALGLVILSLCQIPALAGEKEVRKAVVNFYPGVEIRAVIPDRIPGLFRVNLKNGDSILVSEDGKHIVEGKVYELSARGTKKRLSPPSQGLSFAGSLSQVPESEMVVFPARGARRGYITVFTDIECGFCRQLHLEVPFLQNQGIEVRYLAFPRAGLGSGVHEQMVSIWCSANSREAMSKAKLGKFVRPRTCPNPVANQYQLGLDLGVQGTPYIFLSSGVLIPGYIDANEILSRLELERRG